MARDNTTRDNRLKALEQVTKDLENKSCELEDKLFERDTDTEAFKMNIQMNLRGIDSLRDRVEELEEHDENHEGRIAELEKQMKDANDKLLLVGSGGDGVDGDALSSLLENLRKECAEKYAAKEDFEDLKGRVEALEREAKELTETVGEKKDESGLNSLSEEIKELKARKMDKEDYENRERLKTDIERKVTNRDNATPRQDDDDFGPQQFSDSEAEKLRAIILSYPETEKDLRQLIDELKDVDLKTLKDWIKNLDERLDQKADKTDLGPIKDELNKLKELLEQLAKELGYLKAAGTGDGATGPVIDGDVIIKIEKLEK